LAYEGSQKERSALYKPHILSLILWNRAACLAAALLIISSWIISFVLYREVSDLRRKLALRDTAVVQNDNSATINFYLKEHQDVIARNASYPAIPQSLQMQVNQNDILYYELFDDQTEYMHPGIIVRGPSSQHEISSSESQAISNGNILTLSEARATTDFDLVLPSWLYPGYTLDQIRSIEDRDALQLLYIDGINSVSLFEQPLDGQRKLKPHDYREYAVYRNQGRTGGTILAWRDEHLSYVLIGNIEMSQLMKMAQSISVRK
jgi:hypothetical protein